MRIDIEVTGGVVRGGSEGDLAVFRGIPYASLPVRFGAPQPVAAWDGVREAVRFGPPPPQSGVFGTDALGEEGEDWLTVNVWSSDLGGRLPVMVWIQGGAYMFGMSGLPEYDGVNLAHGEVVVVTFNYRVGLEGFGYIEGTPVNRGLLDQLAALEWVRDNIGTFGGDPDRVTVFGQSAGAGSVAALLAMPRAAGLFHRAIAQSVPGTYFTPRLAADVTRACAAELGLQPAELSTVDPRLLPAVGDAVLAKMGQFTGQWGRAAHALVPFAPVVDGEVLPTTPWRGLTSNTWRFMCCLGSVGLAGDGTRGERSGAERETGSWSVQEPEPMRPVNLPLAGPLLDEERIGVVYTIWMEALLPKRRILELYANVIEMGPGIYGVEAASQHYFGISARGLTREQSAMLAALLPNPKHWDPTKPGGTLRWRQRRILQRERNANFPERLLR